MARTSLGLSTQLKDRLQAIVPNASLNGIIESLVDSYEAGEKGGKYGFVHLATGLVEEDFPPKGKRPNFAKVKEEHLATRKEGESATDWSNRTGLPWERCMVLSGEAHTAIWKAIKQMSLSGEVILFEKRPGNKNAQPNSAAKGLMLSTGASKTVVWLCLQYYLYRKGVIEEPGITDPEQQRLFRRVFRGRL